jgi:fucose 4-O-acetylase-like acetyltransferase
MKSPKSRNLRIDTLRGLACLLLVLYHVVGNTEAAGLRLDRAHPLVVFNDILGYLRMPLFSLLSGYVYAKRPFSRGAGTFVLGKARRLLVPMLVVGTAFACLQSVVPGSNGLIVDWHLLHIMPVAHYWFLESLFIIFVLILALEKFNALRTQSSFAMVFAVAACLFVIQPLPMLLGMSGAVYLLPFVLLGLWSGRFARTSTKANANPSERGQFQLGLAVFLLGVLYAVMVLQRLPEQGSLCALLVSCGACLLALHSRVESTALAWVGGHSFAIFLFHSMATAASRIVLLKFGLSELFLLVTCGMVLGVAFPVMLARSLERMPAVAVWVLGASPAKPRPAVNVLPGSALTVTAPALSRSTAYPARAKRLQSQLQRARAELAAFEPSRSLQSQRAADTLL